MPTLSPTARTFSRAICRQSRRHWIRHHIARLEAPQQPEADQRMVLCGQRNNMIEYDPFSLLQEFDKDTIRKYHARKCFYHGLGAFRLESVKKGGLDPAHSEERSTLAGRKPELGSNKFCTMDHRSIAIVAGDRDLPPVWGRGPTDKIMVLRTKARSVLNRRFGVLDSSFYELWSAVQKKLQMTSKQHLTAVEFLSLLNTFGVICCYDPIPPRELEVCTDVLSFGRTGECRFVSLLEYT
jgi:hypothetical protein